ncbi:MAG: phosphatidylglycerophosphatase A [Gammaproteobacteria bacterium]|nr:MAG: phosphatidylglycerophosphatase A [Gammaproteobacteria bacterium]
MVKLAVTSTFKTIPPLPDNIWQRPLYFIAFGFGSGTLPIAPGTFGTLMAIPFYLLFQSLPLPLYLLFVLLFTALSCWICERVSREIQVHDHPGMCIDEFAGFFVTMINAPHGWLWILLGFLLFRLFDIWKPWPIRDIDKKMHNGIGIVLDDIVAGLYALIIIQIIARIFS